MKTTHIFFTGVHMFKKTFIMSLILVSIGTKAFSMGDTIIVSYDDSPVTYEKVTNVSVASVYMEIAWKIMENRENYEFLLKVNDEKNYNALQKKIDSISRNSTDPNDILIHVKNNRFKSEYVLLVFANMTKNYIGVRTPLSVKMAFDRKGYLSHFECHGFIKTDDGFVLKEFAILPIKFHKSDLRELGL